MNAYSTRNKELYYRLIALWVVCEALAGGIMHASKIPFTGMVISSFSVICIILIAHYFPSKSAIIRATVIVAVFKLMLSPHSPPTAYVAVFFQGCLGQLLFYNRRPAGILAVLLAVLSLVESAVQRILVLLIIYGNSFWQAFDRFITKLFGSSENNYSTLLASLYIIIHALVGIFVGIFAMRLLKNSGRTYDVPLLTGGTDMITTNPPAPNRRKKTGIIFILLWIFMILLLVQAWADPANALLPLNETLLISLRSVLIVTGWYLIFTPLIMKFIKAGLQSQQQKKSFPLNEILMLLPGTKYIFTESWKLSAGISGINRVRLFLKTVIVNILVEKNGQTGIDK
ncbi:MAG: hypothetical protein WKF88_08785 [Ferruginibacter sp.]